MADPPRLTYYFPIGGFVRVAADTIVLALNALVKDVNAGFSALGGTSAGFVTMKQLKQAMASQGVLRTYHNIVGADITTTLNILWLNGGTITVGETLYNDIALQLGYSAAQMVTLFTLAQTFPP